MMNKKIYKKELHELQIELVKFHKSVIEKGKKVCIIFEGRDAMFVKTNFIYAPWHIVHSNSKKRGRINAIKHFLSHVDYPGKDENKLLYDPSIVFGFDPECYKKGGIEP